MRGIRHHQKIQSPESFVILYEPLALIRHSGEYRNPDIVDIVSSAEGKTIPSGYVKQIQPLEKGVVKSILVKEGQLVQQGQPLIELGRTLTAADQAKLTKDLAYLDQTIRRQELFVKLLANPDQAANIPKLRASFLIRTSSVIPAQAGIQGSPDTLAPGVTAKRVVERIGEIGRASCRERVYSGV